MPPKKPNNFLAALSARDWWRIAGLALIIAGQFVPKGSWSLFEGMALPTNEVALTGLVLVVGAQIAKWLPGGRKE